MKIAYIIPGFNESHLKQKGYRKIAEFFVEQKIKPIHVNIKWHYKKPINFELYNKLFLKRYKKRINDEVYVLGFSFGAIIAFLTESQTKPKALILCSLSPYFLEDHKNLKPSWLKWWRKNFKNEYRFNELIKSVRTKAYIIVGDKEPESVLIRSRDTKRKLKRSSFLLAKGARHNINQREYLKVLEKLISKL